MILSRKQIIDVTAVFTGALLLVGGVQLKAPVEIVNPLAASANGAAGAMAYSVSLINEAEVAETEIDTVASPIYGYTNLGIAVVSEGNLNIRETPDEEGHMVGKLPNKAACEILEEVDGWYHITSGEIEGYVKASYVVTGDAARALADELAMDVVISHADNLRVREEPSTESDIITEVAANEEIGYLGETDGWFQVEVNGDTGYVSSEFAEHYQGLNVALSMSEARFGKGVSDVRVDLVNEALKYVGNPYVWGGTSLTNGADCSGFVLSIFAQYGISLPHSSAAQSNYGRQISTSELQPGDLIFYGRGGRSIGHVAIYIGGGQIVHASDSRTGIRVSNAFYTTPVCCTSLLD